MIFLGDKITELYKNNGCCLHIVLEDDNLEDENILFCIQYAKENGHNYCKIMAEKLLELTIEQRKGVCLFLQLEF